MNKLIIGLVSFIASFGLMAKSITIETSGEGSTHLEAVDSALTSAIQQVSGVSIENIRASNLNIVKQSGSDTQFSKQAQQYTSVKSKGEVKYRILSDRCNKIRCKVRLRVEVKVPRGESLKKMTENRKNIAISAFKGRNGQSLTSEIENLVVQDRKFNVKNNLNDSEIDYLLQGEIVQANTSKKVIDTRECLELTGECVGDVTNKYSSEVVIRYKLLDVANNYIKWSDTVTTTSNRNNLSLLVKISAEKVFKQLKDSIYPLFIIAAEDGSIVLNAGGKTVKSGEIYDIYREGKQIIDPITKESLGYSETQIGQVRVSKVLPKIAYVELVRGEKSDLIGYPIARKSTTFKIASAPKVKPKAQKQEIKENDYEGVMF